MSSSLQVFLISPGDLLVYSFTDPATGQDSIFHAGTLARITDPDISEVSPVVGEVTPKFKVKPSILGYEDNTYEVNYAPVGSSCLYCCDGSQAKHRGRKLKSNGKISIPDMTKSTVSELVALDLPEPDPGTIQRFVDMSFQGLEYPIENEPPESPKIMAKSPSPRLKVMAPELAPKQTLAPELALKQASEVPSTVLKELKELREEAADLRNEVTDLKSILKALNQRIYQIYPVDLPSQIRMGKTMTPVFPFEKVKAKMDSGDFVRHALDPLLQPYAGSHRSQNRLITFHEKNGDVCHVRVDYDAKNNRINPPK